MNTKFKYETRVVRLQLVSSGGYIATSFRTLPSCHAHRPKSVEDVVSILAACDKPCIVAGGTDLPARWNEGFVPSDLIDVSGIADLKGVTHTEDGLRIGALVTHAEGATDPLVREYSVAFARSWQAIANVRVRFSATIGGNLMARRTRYEGSILLSALGATALLHGPDGAFTRPVETLWGDDLPSRSLLVAITIPRRHDLRFDYERGLRPIMTQAFARDASGWSRLVTATEFARPTIRTISPNGDAQGALDLVDPVTSTAYLRRVSDAFLRRQIARLAA